jgi:hypothetical protein
MPTQSHGGNSRRPGADGVYRCARYRLGRSEQPVAGVSCDGSAAIVACCRELHSRGFERVIAEWVVSVPLYERLGFRVWRIRDIDT